MFKNILVVCMGNICRSPIAQYKLQGRLPGKTVESAGLGALVGHDVDAMAREVALAHQLECPPHSGRQLTPEICRWADIILVMEHRHRDALVEMSPESRGKVFLLGAGLSKGGTDIPDPYRASRDVFERVYSLIDRSTEYWAGKLGAGVK